MNKVCLIGRLTKDPETRYTQTNNTIVLLVNGGDKSAQAKDIEKAHKLLDEWRSKHE